MEEFLGLSFTNRSIALAHTKQNNADVELISIQDILYPFPFEFNMMLNAENLGLLADRIENYVVDNDLVGKEFAISLPMYMAQLKRAALPSDIDERIVQKHLQWEVESLSARGLQEYKVVKLDHSFLFGTYQEYVFVLIQRKILESIKQLADKSSLQLKKVLLDSDTILKYLQHFGLIEEQKNQIIFQIDAFHITTFVYLNGLFFDYSLRSLSYSTEGKSFEARVMIILKEEIERVRSVLGQLPQVSQNIQIFSTRLVTDQMKKYFKKKELQIMELSISSQVKEKGFSSNNIESYAVTL